MSGGRGRIIGTVIGAFVIGILSDGLVMMGVSAFWQTVIKGVVIIAAVVALEAGATLVTSDRGFTRFRSLRLLDPSATP